MGLFVTLEGIDGSGKSTQAKRLVETLRAHGRDAVLTREPGGASGAEEIRRLLVEGAPGRWSPETEMLLFTAARRDHIERVVQPALDAGKIVVCDRYVDSTRAYQGSGPARRLVDRLHDLMIGLDPDLTLIFDLDPETGLARTGARNTGEDRFEQKGIDFQRRLRRAFQTIAEAEPERCRVIAANQSEEAVAATVWETVQSFLAEEK